MQNGLTADDEAKVEEFAGNLFMACLATMELANVELGVRLGLYEALAGAGPVTAAGLAKSAGIAERYAREWLEQQAVAGVVEVDDAAAPTPERRFTLPNAHAHVLTRRRQRGVHEAVRGGRALAGQGDRHHGRGVPPRHRRCLRAVRPARHPGGVHPAGVRQPPDPDVAAGAARRPGEAGDGRAGSHRRGRLRRGLGGDHDRPGVSQRRDRRLRPRRGVRRRGQEGRR